MCDHQRSPWIESVSGQVSDSSVSSGNKNVFVTVLVLYSPRIIRFAHLGMCAAMTGNVVKRLANQNRIICLSEVIGQSDM